MTVSGMWVKTSIRGATLSHDKPPLRRVMIVDDHSIVRQGIKRLLEPEADLLVCAEADTTIGTLGLIKDANPDVIIADINLQAGEGRRLLRAIRSVYPELPILVLSFHDETIYAEAILSEGVRGYISKEASGTHILAALRRVLGGSIFVSEAIGQKLVKKSISQGLATPTKPMDRLSSRERQVLHMVSQGMSTRETAQTLQLSVKTIESHRQRIKNKLHLQSGTQLVQYAINWFTGAEANPRS